MKLNHINLVVSNVKEATTFFETYFGFKCTEVKGDNVIAILNGSDGFILVLMPFNKHEEATYPGAFHVGFMQDNSDQVNDIYEKLKNGGITIDGEPRKIRDSYGFYFHYNSIMIEVGHYLN